MESVFGALRAGKVLTLPEACALLGIATDSPACDALEVRLLSSRAVHTLYPVEAYSTVETRYCSADLWERRCQAQRIAQEMAAAGAWLDGLFGVR